MNNIKPSIKALNQIGAIINSWGIFLYISRKVPEVHPKRCQTYIRCSFC